MHGGEGDPALMQEHGRPHMPCIQLMGPGIVLPVDGDQKMLLQQHLHCLQPLRLQGLRCNASPLAQTTRLHLLAPLKTGKERSVCNCIDDIILDELPSHTLCKLVRAALAQTYLGRRGTPAGQSCSSAASLSMHTSWALEALAPPASSINVFMDEGCSLPIPSCLDDSIMCDGER